MTTPDIQMENTKPLEVIPMTDIETEALRELATDMMYTTPRTAEPVITQGNRTLLYSPDAPNVVTLTWGNNTHALHVLFLYAPGWRPWSAGTWSPPPDTGCWAEYGDCAVYRRGATH